MSRRPRGLFSRARRWATILGALVPLVGAHAARAGAPTEAPRPDTILGLSLLRTPPIDAFTFCPLAQPEAALAETLELAARDPAAALEDLRSSEETPRGALLRAALAARLAQDTGARRRARARLRAPRSEGVEPWLLACADLELARTEVQLKLFPEAAASARRAARAAAEGAEPLREAAAFLRAEALYLGGQIRKASRLYRALASSSNPRIAAAARLRAADVRFDEGRRAQSLPEYEVLLERASSFGAEPLGWAARAAEAAIAAGDLVSAGNWLERLVEGAPNESLEALYAIRMADVVAAQGRPEESRDRLVEVDAMRGNRPEGLLARVRILDLGLEQVASREAIESLRDLIAGASHRGVAAYARAVLARRLLAEGEVDEALPVLLRASYDATAPALVRGARADLARAIGEAVDATVDDAACARLVQRLGDRRALLIRSSDDPEPFLRLGRCYEVLGLPVVAVEVYRSLARAFGARVAESVSLPIARASLAAGDLAMARSAAARATAREGASSGWRLLMAEVLLAQGEAEPAAVLLEKLARDPDGDAPDARAWLLLARAASAAPGSEARRRVLFEGLIRGAEGAPIPGSRDRAEAAMIAAALHRRAGSAEAADALYARALETLPSGDLRAEAGYWLAASRGDPDRAREAFEAAAAASERAPFARLARTRLRLDRLRKRLGLVENASGAT